jgi:Zn finger protein HypA/HybF involved in hydrogenase expression
VHESHLVADLMARVESEIDPGGVRVTRLTLRVGALSGVSATALQDGIEQRAMLAWGYTPDVIVEHTDDIEEPGTMGVTLISMQVEG